MQVTGEPGWHFIDLYPAIYKGKETRPNNYRLPQRARPSGTVIRVFIASGECVACSTSSRERRKCLECARGGASKAHELIVKG
jgi:hypothetical protein